MKTLRLILPLAALVGTAHADIMYSGTRNILIPTTLAGAYIDIDGGGTVPEEGAGWDINPFFGGETIASSPSFHPIASSVALDASVLNLDYGTLVYSGSTFASTYPGGYSGSESHIGNSPGQFASSSEGYLGFKFTTNASSGPYYGWMRVELSNTAAIGIVRDWAFDNTGAAITVGAVPEPSTILSLLAGLATFCCRRRRGKS